MRGYIFTKMSINKKDRIGVRYGKLLVIEAMPSINNKISLWRCVCDCGNIVDVRGGNLNTGNTISCGCYNLECIKNRSTKHGQSKRGELSTEYKTWRSMKMRCLNKNNQAFNDYGGRGIKICDRWLDSFENFLEDMGKKPSKNHSIDRIDNNGDYEPSNCKWATKKEQSCNRRSNKWYEHEGKRMTQKEWANYLGVPVKYFNKMLKSKTFIETYNFYNKKSKDAARNI